jgi:hypothetical protein
MSDTSLTFNLVGRDRGVNSLLTRTATNVRAANMAARASTVAFGAAMVSASAHAIALGSAVAGVAGAAGLLPAVLGASTAGVLAARAATMGLGGAWKATGVAATGGGGAAVDVGKRVAQAQREVRAATQALADAQRDALQAQQAVSRARMEEAERLDDLARSVAGARLDEEGAVLAVARAERDLAAARRTGKPGDIAEADLAYRQAVQTLDEVRDRVGDLSTEQAEGARKGVEGSDAVQDALRRQEQAQRAVTEAAQRLADAQDAVREASAGAAGGGVNPAAAALAKLAPNARAVITTLRALVPAWQGAARAGQQATWAGVAGDLRRLSGIYLPSATSWLQRMGRGFNIALREAAGLASTRRFVRDVDLVLESTALTTNRLARAVRPVINGLMQFAAVGSTFLPGMASSALSLAERFERWAVAARESGKMQQWIGNALALLRQLGAIAGNVAGSVAAIFKAGDGNAGKATLDSLVRGSEAMRKWLQSAEGQAKVGKILSDLRSILVGMGEVIAVVAGHSDEFNAGLSVTGEVVKFAATHLDTLAKLLPIIAAGYVISKVAQTGANIAAVAMVPVKIAEIIAIRQHTAALLANTAATNVGAAATKRSVISSIAMRAASLAQRAATLIATAAQWLWNIAMMANPLGLILLAVIALVAGIVLLWKNSETFRNIVKAVWEAVWGAMKAVWAWVVENFPKLFHILTTPYRLAWAAIKWVWDKIKEGAKIAFDWVSGKATALVNFFRNLPGRVSKAISGLWNGLKNGFKSALNWIISKWNNFEIGIPSLKFAGISLPGFTFRTPNLPMLADGGIVPATPGGRLAILGEGGQDEAVIPLPRGGRGVPGMGGGRAVLEVHGEREIVAFLRRLIKQYNLLEA